MGRFLHNFLITAVIGICSLSSTAAHPVDVSGFDIPDSNIITRDVCIIGGGATGTYAAVRLREDMHKSVVVVERNGRLGGHADTYVDPQTGFPIDYGVLLYLNTTNTTNFFARFNVPLEPLSEPPFQNDFIDFTTGKIVTGYNPPAPGLALQTYAGLLQSYPYLISGYQLPSPVPADLLLPFGQFVEKYNLQDLVPLIWTFGFALGNILETPTLYVIQEFGLPEINALANNGFLLTSHHSNSELYQKALGLLGSDVLLSSNVVVAQRSDKGHKIVVKTPSGMKLIRAKKLLITIPPTVSALAPFLLDKAENDVFRQWQMDNCYVGVISNTGLPDGLTIVNTRPDTPLNLPKPPYVSSFEFSGIPGLYTFTVIGEPSLTESDAKGLVTDAVAKMGSAGTFQTTSNPNIVAFASHSPLSLRVSANSVGGGFYNQLYALQGHSGTFWTGSAWASDYSSILWGFTEGVLPGLAA